MNREQVFQYPLKRFSIDDIEYNGALTPPYRIRAQAQIESALCIEWWRGYYAGIDFANFLATKANLGESHDSSLDIDGIRKAAIIEEQQRCLRILQHYVPQSEKTEAAIRDICCNVMAP